MKPFFTTMLLLASIVFSHLAIAQSEYSQLVADVRTVSKNPHADKADVDRLNRQIRQIFDNDNDSELIKELLTLRVSALADIIDEIAGQIDKQARLGKFARIGIPEFTAGVDRAFDPTYGALPRHIAESLRQALAIKAQSHRNYSVLSEETLHKILKDKKIIPDDFRTEKTQTLQNDVSLLVNGHLNRVGEGGIAIQVNLIDTVKGNQLDGQIGGKAWLDSNEWAMSGLSKFGISPPSPGRALRYRLEPGVGLVSEQILARSQPIRGALVEPHPLTPGNAGNTSSEMFDVWIEVRPIGRGNFNKRPFQYQGNDCYLPLSQGEEYQIRYRSSEDVFVRILVDGLNTLSQKQTTVSSRGAYIEAVANSDADGEFVIAPRVSLEEARPWVIDHTNRGAALTAKGFYDVNNNPNGRDTVRRFQIVDADESAAARKNYTEQIGLITVAFYKAVLPSSPEIATRAGRIGTGMGGAEGTNVGHYAGDKVPGDLIAVYNIRYMTPEMLQQIIR